MFEYTVSIDLEHRLWANHPWSMTDSFVDYLRKIDQVNEVTFNSEGELVITFESEAAATMFLMKHA